MSDEAPIVVTLTDPAVRELLPRYLARRAADVSALRDAVAARTFDTIAVIGHRLRGSGTAYGLPQVSALGDALEQAAKTRDSAAVEHAATCLKSLLDRVQLA